MRRSDALRVALDHTRDLPVVVTLAATSRELAAMEDRPNHLYLLDSMGLAGSVGLGVALALEPERTRPVVVLEGDGSLLMNLGCLATMAYLRPPGLVMVVLDNGVYASTADIPTYADTVDLGAIAAACGLRVRAVHDAAGLADALASARSEPGPHLIHARIEPGNLPATPLLLMDPVVLGERFRSWLERTEDPAP